MAKLLKPDKFAALRRPKVVKDEVFMRRKARMMWHDPEWHAHMRPVWEIHHNGIKFIGHIDPTSKIELHMYRRGSESPDSWYSVGFFRVYGVFNTAAQTLCEILTQIGLMEVASEFHDYAMNNPYDADKYADVEEWLKNL